MEHYCITWKFPTPTCCNIYCTVYCRLYAFMPLKIMIFFLSFRLLLYSYTHLHALSGWSLKQDLISLDGVSDYTKSFL